MLNGEQTDNGVQRTTIDLPTDLHAMFKSWAKSKGLTMQAAMRYCLTTTLQLENGGFHEKIEQLEKKWDADMARLDAAIDKYELSAQAKSAKATEHDPEVADKAAAA